MAENSKKPATDNAGMYMNMEQLSELMATMIREMKKEAVVAADPNKVHTRIPAQQEMVKVKLFRDNGKYKDDVYVSVNGKRYIVPRGVEVEVPAGVAEILETSMAQDEATERFVRRQVDDWEVKEKKL